jgi:hypothetical protein
VVDYWIVGFRKKNDLPLFHQSITHYSSNPSLHFLLPRGVIRSAPVSDTGGPGAKPGEATINKVNKISFSRQLVGCFGIDSG